MRGKPIKLEVPNTEGQLSFMFTRGGTREGAGRKGFGETKKVSLTLTGETWNKMEQLLSNTGTSRSEVIRSIIELYFQGK